MDKLYFKSDTSLLRDQYEKFIYPLPLDDIQFFIDKNIRFYNDPTYYWHKIWPEKEYVKNINILVAGCGANEAAILAKCNPDHNFVGVDISKKAIEHCKSLKLKNNIKNLDLICDDFRNINFNQKFDLIISTGVIHHLSNPSQALDFFNTILNNGGILSLMVYGDKITKGLNEVKKLFNLLKIEQNDEGIKKIKSFFLNLYNNHPAKYLFDRSHDSKFDSGIIDLTLNKIECFFSIKDLIKLLSNSNLIIKSFQMSNIKSLTKFFFHDLEAMKTIRKLPVNDQLELGQILNWNDHQISFFCIKKDEQEKSIIYNPPNFQDNKNIYFCARDGCSFEFFDNKIILTLETKEKYSFNVIINNISYWKDFIRGQITLKDLLNLYDDNDQKQVIMELIVILFENVFLDISFYPIKVKRFF